MGSMFPAIIHHVRHVILSRRDCVLTVKSVATFCCHKIKSNLPVAAAETPQSNVATPPAICILHPRLPLLSSSRLDIISRSRTSFKKTLF